MTISEKRKLKLKGRFTTISKTEKTIAFGFTHVYIRDRSFRVEYGGNMGATEDNMNRELREMFGVDNTDFWKKHSLVRKFTEKGSYDYLYCITFYLKKAG